MSLTVSSFSTGALPTFAPQTAWDDAYTGAWCSYPVSGSYSLLPRILFYFTLIFATLVHGHLWLVAGALVAALSYSGTAAFHAILLIWRGPAMGAQDIDALMAILSTSCLVSVPLLNWSSTLRRLGASARELKEMNSNFDAKSADYEEEAKDASEFGTRTIVIYWAILVTVGFISVWAAENWSTPTRTFFPISANISTVQCAPGTNTSTWIVDPAFVSANRCDNPCASIQKSEIFRPVTDLVLLTDTQVLRFYGVIDAGAEKRISTAIAYYFSMSKWVFPYILLQGANTVCFGRRSPRQARDLLWIGLTRHSPKNWPHVRIAQRGFCGFFATFVYLGAWFVAIICTPGVLFNIAVNELLLNSIDMNAESPYMIGQWGPWCSTGLVLLAALIGRYHRPCVDAIFYGLTRLFTPWNHRQLKEDATDTRHHPVSSDAEKCHGARVPATQQPRAKQPSYIARQLRLISRPFKESYIRFVNEWKNFGAWCRDPDQVCATTSRHPPQRLMGRGVDPRNPGPGKPVSSSATPSIVACHHNPDEQCANCASIQAIPAHDHSDQHDYSVKRPTTGGIGPMKTPADDQKSTTQEGTGEERWPLSGERVQSPNSLSLPREIETRSVHPSRDNPDYAV